jgi:type II secretion system protein N
VTDRKRLILYVLAYTLYGLVVFLVLLYIIFPYDLLRQRVTERFSQADLQLAIARLGPAFPPGVRLQNVRLLVNQAGFPGALMQIETLHARPALLDLLARTLHIRLDATIYSGTLKGSIRSVVAGDTAAWELEAQFAELQLERHPLVKQDNQAVLRGQLGGELSVTLDNEGLMQQGALNLRLQSVVFVVSQVFPLPAQREVTCDTVQSQIRLTPGQWQITSFMCRGNDLAIQVRGTIRWQSPLRASVLELQVQMRSETAYKQEIDLIGNLVQRRPDRRGVLSFSIRGTLQQPRYGT